jgi:hypothetical protein
MSALEIKEALQESVWNNYFKFTVIRNPFDKLVSAFYHFEKKQKQEKYKDRLESDVFLFREWIAAGGGAMDRKMYVIDGDIAVDFFIRYESLIDGIVNVCKKLNVTDYTLDDLPSYKSGIRSNEFSLVDMYDDKTEEIVRAKFKFEIDLFGYSLK